MSKEEEEEQEIRKGLVIDPVSGLSFGETRRMTFEYQNPGAGSGMIEPVTSSGKGTRSSGD